MSDSSDAVPPVNMKKDSVAVSDTARPVRLVSMQDDERVEWLVDAVTFEIIREATPAENFKAGVFSRKKRWVRVSTGKRSDFTKQQKEKQL